MHIEQQLESGVICRNDIAKSRRLVFFETDSEDWKYASHGGTAFIVSYQHKHYAITAEHVIGDFAWKDLVLTRESVSDKISGVSAIYKSKGITNASKGTELSDIIVIELCNPSNAEFFKDTAYILEAVTTAESSNCGDQLTVWGCLKDGTTITEDTISPEFCRLQFIDNTSEEGLSDITTRSATARYLNKSFERLTGISGAPVFNDTKSKLCGVVVRGAMVGETANIHYVDVFDVLKILEAIQNNTLNATYEKHRRELNN